MGKANKPKRAWKKISDAEIVGVLEKESRDQLRGTDFTAVRDQELFVIDAAGTSAPPPLPSSSARATKKQLARTRLTRAQAILLAAHQGKTVPAGPAPRERGKLPEPIQLQKMMAAPPGRGGGAPPPPAASSPPNPAALRKRAAQAHRAAQILATTTHAVQKKHKQEEHAMLQHVADAWGNDEHEDAPLAAKSYVPPRLPGSVLTAAKPHKRLGIAPRPRIPAVEVDMGGCSYHPEAEAHEEALAVAVAKEYTRELRAALVPSAPPKLLVGPPPDPYDGLVVSEQEDDSDNDSGGQEEQEEEDVLGAGLNNAKKKEKKKKLTSDRNKEKRMREEQFDLDAKRALKKQRRELQDLQALQAEVEEEEAAREVRRARRAVIQAERARTEAPRLTKHRFEGENMRVLLSEELTGSMRNVKSEGLLLKDRFLAMQKRGVVEIRPKNHGHKAKKGKRIVYTHGERGDKALERQVELTEMIRKNKASAKDKEMDEEDM